MNFKSPIKFLDCGQIKMDIPELDLKKDSDLAALIEILEGNNFESYKLAIHMAYSFLDLNQPNHCEALIFFKDLSYNFYPYRTTGATGRPNDESPILHAKIETPADNYFPSLPCKIFLTDKISKVFIESIEEEFKLSEGITPETKINITFDYQQDKDQPIIFS